MRTRVPDDSAAPTKPSPATPIRTPSPKPGSARASPTRSRLAEAAPAAAAPPPHPVSPASPARRVRIADIEQPHDGSQRSTSAFADPAALQDESLAPEAGLSEAAMSPQRSMRSESHASSPMASGHLLPAPAAGLGTVGASSRSLSCPEVRAWALHHSYTTSEHASSFRGWHWPVWEPCDQRRGELRACKGAQLDALFASLFNSASFQALAR